LRERKKRRTFALIEQTALKLFVTNGFESTTVDDIAAAVAVSPRTFFRYFPTKEHVVFSSSEQVLDRLRTSIRGASPDVPDALALRDGFLVLATSLERHRDENVSRARLIAESPALRARAVTTESEWVRVLGSELAKRSGRRLDFTRRVLVESGLSANRAATDEWAARSGRGSLRRLITLAFDALIQQYDLAARAPATSKK